MSDSWPKYRVFKENVDLEEGETFSAPEDGILLNVVEQARNVVTVWHAQRVDNGDDRAQDSSEVAEAQKLPKVQKAVCSECGDLEITAFAGMPCLRVVSCQGEYELREFAGVRELENLIEDWRDDADDFSGYDRGVRELLAELEALLE